VYLSESLLLLPVIYSGQFIQTDSNQTAPANVCPKVNEIMVVSKEKRNG
jgi:hypothetical protein